MKKVLIVEDDQQIAQLLTSNLMNIGFDVHHETSGKKGLEQALSGEFSLLILDIMLPEMDGTEVCKAVRQKSQELPILMLTARSEEFDRVLGLELGADDYITKPFSVRELVARVKALLRRSAVTETSQQDQGSPVLEIKELEINKEKRKVKLHGALLDLTAKEYDLLLFLAAHPGRPFSRDQLLEKVWGYQFSGYEHTVNSHVNRLRAKLKEDSNNPRFIITVWGVGYRFAEISELEPN